MDFKEFSEYAASLLTRRTEDTLSNISLLYDQFTAGDDNPEEFLLRAFSGFGCPKEQKVQLRASDYRNMLPPDRHLLFDELCNLRYDLSKEEDLPAYIILYNKAIYNICRQMPETEEDLAAISYVGKKKAEKYGPQILAVVHEYAGG